MFPCRDNKALLSSTKACFSGRDLIDFLIAHGDFLARGEAQQFGQHLFSMGFLQHGEYVALVLVDVCGSI